MLATRTDTTLWARRPDLADRIRSDRENAAYLPGFELPAELEVGSDLEAAVTGADLIVMAVPSHGFRSVLESVADRIASSSALISLSKGVERDTMLRMTEVAAQTVSIPTERIGVLTGPNLAREIAQGQPAAAVIAVPDSALGAALQSLFMQPTFRVYTNADVVGCESAGALKNVMAIAAGMAHGLGYGDNSKAALVTRALAELTRLGVALGGSPLTFSGLAGMGDLVATCFSEQSRNRTVGVRLGKGSSLDDIVSDMNMVAEGVKSTAAILALADRHSIEMPIARMVGAVLYDGAHPADMVAGLMTREAKAELHGIE
jgi:glycerol-3-phosphate dehydrogenase (NAD(P)+)